MLELFLGYVSGCKIGFQTRFGLDFRSEFQILQMLSICQMRSGKADRVDRPGACGRKTSFSPRHVLRGEPILRCDAARGVRLRCARMRVCIRNVALELSLSPKQGSTGRRSPGVSEPTSGGPALSDPPQRTARRWMEHP